MKIAIIRLSALGDIIHTSIVVQFIKKHFKDAKISWFVDEKFSSIVHLLDGVDVIALPLKDKKFIKSFKILREFSNHFDLIIDFQGLIKSALVAKVLGSNIAGFDKNSIKEPLASIFYKSKFKIDYNENIIRRNLALASAALGFSFNDNDIKQKSACFISNIEPKPSQTILIAPFASEMSKCYDKFNEVINLLKDYEINIISANAKEYELASKIAYNTHAKVLSPMSLSKVIDFMQSVGLVIGNDSGITHLAWAQNRASITLFGNRPSHRNSFITPINHTIDTGKKIDAKNIDKSDYCINEISPINIANLAKNILNSELLNG